MSHSTCSSAARAPPAPLLSPTAKHPGAVAAEAEQDSRANLLEKGGGGGVTGGTVKGSCALKLPLNCASVPTLLSYLGGGGGSRLGSGGLSRPVSAVEGGVGLNAASRSLWLPGTVGTGDLRCLG